MTEILFTLFLAVHGLIHLLGFFKAFELASVEQLKSDLSKTEGFFWLLSTLLFLGTATLFFLDYRLWREFGLISIALSQILIILSWQDAKFGTIANFLILAAAIMAFESPNSDPDEFKNFDRESFLSYLEKRIITEMDHYAIPGASILIISNEQVIWQKAFGYADLDKQLPLTTGSTMMAHSISKSVTAWGIMRLVEGGALRLDDPVINYIDNWSFPESDYPADEVTTRRLLSNSAGVPLGTIGVHYSTDEDVPPIKQSLAVDEIRLVSKPGTQFLYSNSGYALLELLIEEVTGRDFAAYMQAEVLMPLGMTNSSFAWQESMDSKIPKGYDLNGNAVPAYLYPYQASGGLFTTLEDIGQFVLSGMQSSNLVLNSAGIQEIYQPNIEINGMFGQVAGAYGLGHFIEILPDGQKAVWHGGQGLGWMTHFHSVPGEGAGIVILTNSQRSWPFMADILYEWSLWEGFGPVKFSRIRTGRVLMQFLITALMLLSLWKVWSVAAGIKSRRRKPMLKLGGAPAIQMGEFAGWIFITAGLLWAYTRDYLFITSIFPAEATWLARALLFLSLVLLISALIPSIQKQNPPFKGQQNEV